MKRRIPPEDQPATPRRPPPLDGPFPTRTLEAEGEPDRHPYVPHPADDWLRAQLGRQ
jgi:hypothetical protein